MRYCLLILYFLHTGSRSCYGTILFPAQVLNLITVLNFFFLLDGVHVLPVQVLSYVTVHVPDEVFDTGLVSAHFFFALLLLFSFLAHVLDTVLILFM